MNMIEKVARAIANSAGIDPDINICRMQPQLVKGGGFVIPPDDFIGPAWTQYIMDARNVIEAIREPTLFMLDTMDAIDTRELAKDMWQAGIDAALKEE